MDEACHVEMRCMHYARRRKGSKTNKRERNKDLRARKKGPETVA